MKKAISFIFSFLLMLLIAVGMFIFIEGFFSSLFVIKKINSQSMIERLHTQYDELLGWATVPNIFKKDLYGKGLYFKANSQGFRSNVEFPKTVPAGKIRIICSGDSFTMGLAVDNDHTWCQLLTTLDTRLESVNMGLGGYGVDQSYLLYMRDGVKLDHQIHIFAFIGEGFNRAQRLNFMGSGKPFLKLENDKLVVTNVPVSKMSYYIPWVGNNIQVINQLRTVEVLKKFFPEEDIKRKDVIAASRKVALKIFDNLLEESRSSNSTVMMVYLPTPYTVGEDSNADLEIRNFLDVELKKRGIPFLDLTHAFRETPKDKMSGMFRGGHFSNEGNQLAAEKIYQKLLPLLSAPSVGQ